MADKNLVLFVSGLAAEYAALETKDPNTLYFITDERRIYKGDVPMSGGIYKAVSEFPAAGETNVIYVSTSTGEVRFWNGAAYQTLVKAYATEISGNGDNLHLPTTKAIVDYVTSAIADLDMSDVTDSIDALDTRVTAAEGKLTTIQGTGEGSIKKALDDAKAYTDELADGAVKDNTDAIADLESGKADKATTLAGYGITDAYTKTESDTKIAEAVADASHLKRAIVTALPHVSDADENTIYMVAREDGEGEQRYDEYLLINYEFEKIGDTAVSLTGYATESYVDTAKAAAIAAAATDATTKADAAQAAAEATAAEALSTYKTANDAAVKANADAIDTLNGEGEGSVSKAVADALAEAKEYADGLGDDYATAAQGAKADSALQPEDIIEGNTNGTISVDGTDVAVKGLGSAAYTAATAYEPAGKAAQALADAKEYADGLQVVWTSL